MTDQVKLLPESKNDPTVLDYLESVGMVPIKLPTDDNETVLKFIERKLAQNNPLAVVGKPEALPVIKRTGGKKLVKGKLVSGIDSIRYPGQFIWSCKAADSTEPSGILFMCPCGCQKLQFIMVDNDSTKDEKGFKWKWNGDLERPSLAESIQKEEGCYWQGNLVGGTWVVRG